MANYAKTNIGNEGRVELHEALGLTGAEVSVNKLPAGADVPFVHAHKNNEEIYGVLEGAVSATIDGEDIELAAGDWLRVSPPRRAPPVPRRVRLGHHVRLHPGQAGVPRRPHGRRRHHALIRDQRAKGQRSHALAPRANLMLATTSTPVLSSNGPTTRDTSTLCRANRPPDPISTRGPSSAMRTTSS